MSLRGRLRGNRFFVSILSFTACTPLEAPFDWAGRQPATFRLRNAPPVEQLNPVLTNADITEGVDGWKLSNFEWSRVEHLFPAGSKLTSGSRAREFMNAILAKLGTGVGWAGVNSKFDTTSAVSSFYQSCRRSGRWDKVMAILMEIRKQSVTSLKPRNTIEGESSTANRLRQNHLETASPSGLFFASLYKRQEEIRSQRRLRETYLRPATARGANIDCKGGTDIVCDSKFHACRPRTRLFANGAACIFYNSIFINYLESMRGTAFVYAPPADGERKTSCVCRKPC